ncbi:non-ribosomal peptide synthetase [Teredinibacter turnerae]|uniref:non-ribosomal peptide synthetase n=1 Tax=Teredinibacter turnerae TaxID=2426 RepID=UPI000375A409|nr:non-ribosomal peptide synthetase [Teredinibacter turnerae]
MVENTSYSLPPALVASEPETQFWLADQKGRRNAYNVICALQIRGLDQDRLINAVSTTLAKFRIFNATYSFANGDLHRDYSGKALDVKIADAPRTQSWFEDQCQADFSLEHGPLCRLIIEPTAQADTKRVAIVFHHIVMDLASKDIIKEYIEHAYNGNICAFKQAQDNYDLVTADAASWLASPAGERAKTYWQERTNGIQKHTQIHSGAESSDRLMKTATLPLPAQLQTAVVDFAKAHSSSPFLVMLTAYYWLLSKYANETNFAVGVPLSLRRNSSNDTTIGCLISVAPIIAKLEEGTSFLAALKEIRFAMLGAHRHPFYPSFVSGSGQDNGKLFCNGFTFEHPFTLALNDAEVSPLAIRPNEPQLALFMRCWQDGNALHGDLEYDTSVFNHEFAERFNASYISVLGQMVSSPDAALSDINYQPAQDCALIAEVNATETEYDAASHLMDLFEVQVAKAPHNTALRDSSGDLSYAELNAEANRRARALIETGVKPGDVVALFYSRSRDMIASIYAIQKAGAAYLPIDIQLPADRVSYMLRQASCKLLLNSVELPTGLEFSGQILAESEFGSIAQTQPTDTVAVTRDPDATAYIIFTSGSTGRPKGVANSHRGVANRLLWMQETFHLGTEQIALFKTPYNFDVSVWEIFWPLQTGATLAIAAADSHLDPYSIAEQIKQFQANLVHFVPAMLSALLAAKVDGLPSVKTVICSGEELKQEHQQQFYAQFKTATLYNLYGPTEAAIDVSCWTCTPTFAGHVLPIGKPVANTQLHIVDEQMRPVPVGVMGELLIAGVQVAQGYVGAENLTAERFIANPFGKGRVYRTGDFARWNSAGEIEFLGRKDFQVKINGLRIELAEIENVMMSFSGIELAVVTTLDTGNSTALVAHYTCASGVTVQEADLIAYLSGKLPAYEIPRYFQQLAAFSLTSSGKVDRKHIPVYSLPQLTEDVAPTGDLSGHQKIIHDAWCEVLGKEQCGLDVGFFEAGGDSLGMMTVHSLLNSRHNFGLSRPDMFTHPSIRSLAEHLDNRANIGSAPSATPIAKASASSRAQKMRQAMRKPKRANI